MSDVPTIDSDDVLQDALQLFGRARVDPEEEGRIRYGPLVLTVAPKEGRANTLLADHVFSPSLVIAEHIDRGLVNLAGLTLVELGAGAGLPSLFASTLPNDNAPSLIVVTDYPDPLILGNVEANILRNAKLVVPQCHVEARGHEWGEPVDDLLTYESTSHGYDVVFLSDLLHFHTSHAALLRSLVILLARKPHARVYVGAGKYTPAYVCDDWLHNSGAAGLEWEEVTEDDVQWQGQTKVVWEGQVLDVDALSIRKANCRMWVGRWGSSCLP